MESLKINRIILMANKCKKLVVIKRKRISLPWRNGGKANGSAALKGHFSVYAADKRCFAIPLAYLNNKIFRKLLKLSEEEFGLKTDGPITLPCDAFFIQHLFMLMQEGAARNLEKALLTYLLVPSPPTPCRSSTVF